MENKSVKALEHFSLVPFSKLILNETILIIFSISQRLESFAAHPLRITALGKCRDSTSIRPYTVIHQSLYYSTLYGLDSDSVGNPHPPPQKDMIEFTAN
jgi:hypothetical protein